MTLAVPTSPSYGYIIVGSGIAGLYAALLARERAVPADRQASVRGGTGKD